MERALVVSLFDCVSGYAIGWSEGLMRACATRYLGDDSVPSLEKIFTQFADEEKLQPQNIYLWEGEVCDMSDDGVPSYETRNFRLASVADVQAFFPDMLLVL